MIFNASKPILDALIATIQANYNNYLFALASAESLTAKGIAAVKVGIDYQAKGIAKPFMLIEPTAMEIEDESVGVVGAKLLFDVAIMIDGLQESDAIYLSCLYADAFVGMVTSDDFLDGAVTHASVPRIEYFPGGSTTQRVVLLTVEILLEEER